MRDGVKDKEMRRRNAYQLVTGGKPAPSLQCSSDWPRQTSLRIVNAWITRNISLHNTSTERTCRNRNKKDLAQVVELYEQELETRLNRSSRYTRDKRWWRKERKVRL